MLHKQIYSIFLLLLTFSITSLQCHEISELDLISPLELIVPQRADIMAKYIYAKHREWNTTCQFGKNIYYQHLNIWNHFYEDSPPKRSFADYYNSFNKLLNSIKMDGFNSNYPIPLDKGGIIANGSHRLTASLLYNKKVFVKYCSDIRNYSFEFFKTLGLDSKYLDAMALQYCELKKNSHLILIFPKIIQYEKQIEEIIKRYVNIVHKKNVLLTPNGAFNLVMTMYDGEPWIGNLENNYQGARNKTIACFPEQDSLQNPILVFLIEGDNLDLVKKCKKEIRELFGNYHHCIHATDTHKEALVLARSLFNSNSIHCLNYRKDQFFQNFETYINNYREALNQKENDWFCIDGGAVLSAYGLRDCNDFDVLHFESNINELNSPSIESHNAYLPFHAYSLDDILFDPELHFFYRGVKFCTLSVVKQMKMRRKESKDLQDISLIHKINISFEKPHMNSLKILQQ